MAISASPDAHRRAITAIHTAPAEGMTPAWSCRVGASAPRHDTESARLPRPMTLSRRVCLTPNAPSYPRSNRARCSASVPLAAEPGSIAPCGTPFRSGRSRCRPSEQVRVKGVCRIDSAASGDARRVQCRPGLRPWRARGRRSLSRPTSLGSDSVLQIRTGAAPGPGNAAIGALLASATVASWTASTPAGGQITGSNPASVTVSAASAAAYIRILTSGGTALSTARFGAGKVARQAVVNGFVLAASPRIRSDCARQTRRLGGVIRDRCADSSEWSVIALQFAHACKYATSGVGGRRRHSCCRGAADVGRSDASADGGAVAG